MDDKSFDSPKTPSSLQLPSGASASFFSHPSTSARKLVFSESSSLISTAEGKDVQDVSISSIATIPSEITQDLQEKKPPSSPFLDETGVTLETEDRKCSNRREGPQTSDEETKYSDNTISADTAFTSILVPAPQVPENGVSIYRDRLKSLLSSAKEEFERCSRLSSISRISSTEETNECSQIIFDETNAESYKGTSIEVEAERLKLRHCENTVITLQKKILRLEESLSVADAARSRERKALEEVGQMFDCLSAEFEERERKRIAQCQRIIAENFNLQGNLRLAQRLAQDSVQQVDDLKIRLDTKQHELDKMFEEFDILTLQRDSQNEQLLAAKNRIAALEQSLSGAESERSQMEKLMHQRKEDCHRLEMDLQRKERETESLKAAMSALKTETNEELKQKEKEFEVRLDSVTQRMEHELRNTCAEINAEKKVKVSELENLIRYQTSKAESKILRLTTERDTARKKLESLEKDLTNKEAAMCNEIQSRLARKYQELLAEFGHLSNCTHHPSYPVHERDQSTSTQHSFDSEERKHQLQILLKQAIKRTGTGKTMFGHGLHPLDPPSDSGDRR